MCQKTCKLSVKKRKILSVKKKMKKNHEKTRETCDWNGLINDTKKNIFKWHK